MSKVTITLEDDPISGGVKVVCNPALGLLAKKEMGGHGGGITAAEGLAMFAGRKILEESKRVQKHYRLELPPGFDPKKKH